jgi:hypothetical protein
MWNLIPIPYRIIIGALCAILLYAVAYYHGAMSTTKQYLPQIAELKGILQTADEIANAAEQQHQENADAIKIENAGNIERISAYYSGLLHATPATNSASPVAAGPGGADATPGEQSTAGCGAEFAQACLLDANKVIEWQEWAQRNRIPVTR